MTDNECSICYESIENAYSFNGCRHSICVPCSEKMRGQSTNDTESKTPFNHNISVLLDYCNGWKTGLTQCTCNQTSLICPLCRQPETIYHDMEILRQNHKYSYAIWLDSELRWNGNHGLHHIVDSCCFGYGRKRYNVVYAKYFAAGEVVSPYNDNTPLKYRVNDSLYSYKDQIKEYKRTTISNYKVRHHRKIRNHLNKFVI